MAASVSKKNKIAYFDIPKTASTSVKMALYYIEKNEKWTNNPDEVHNVFPLYPLAENDFISVKDYWKFTIIRDPISRLLSAYGNRVLFHQDILNDVRKDFKKRFKFFLNPNLSTLPKYDNFFFNLKKYQEYSYYIWHHTVSVTTFIGNDLTLFDNIYRIEDLNLLEKELTQRSGREVKLGHEQTQGVKIKFEMLSAQTRKKLLEYTKSDYNLLKDFYSQDKYL